LSDIRCAESRAEVLDLHGPQLRYLFTSWLDTGIRGQYVNSLVKPWPSKPQVRKTQLRKKLCDELFEQVTTHGSLATKTSIPFVA